MLRIDFTCTHAHINVTKGRRVSVNDFSQIQSVSIDLGLQVDQIDLTYVNELPATYSSLYGENQLPSTVTIGEQGQLIIMVSKYLNNSEKNWRLFEEWSMLIFIEEINIQKNIPTL